MLTKKMKWIATKAFELYDGPMMEKVYAAVEAVLAEQPRAAEQGVNYASEVRESVPVFKCRARKTEQTGSCKVCGTLLVDMVPAQPPAGDDLTSSDGPCQKCGRLCECWFTNSHLWNQVNGEATGLLCLRCFVMKAEKSGINKFAWRLVLDAPAPNEQPPAGDALERMCDAYLTSVCGSAPHCSVAPQTIKGMTAALAVAQQERDAQWEKALNDVYFEGMSFNIPAILREVRNRLAKPAEQTPEQKVEAILAKSQGDICTKGMRESVAAEIVAALRDGKEGK